MMNAHDMDFDAIKPIDLNTDTTKPDSTDTPLSIFIYATSAGDADKALEQVSDDIEWGLMPYNKYLKGKDEVRPWLQAAAGDKKTPITITNAKANDWGVFEYWNIGTVSQEVIDFGNSMNWPWPKDPSTFIGQKYRVAQCFVYHLNGDGKIDFMRQYLDTGSVWAQLK